MSVPLGHMPPAEGRTVSKAEEALRFRASAMAHVWKKLEKIPKFETLLTFHTTLLSFEKFGCGMMLRIATNYYQAVCVHWTPYTGCFQQSCEFIFFHYYLLYDWGLRCREVKCLAEDHTKWVKSQDSNPYVSDSKTSHTLHLVILPHRRGDS